MHNDKGALLFRGTTYRFRRFWQAMKIVSLVCLALGVLLFVSEVSMGLLNPLRSLRFAVIALGSLSLLLYASARKVEFYEKGIRFPSEFVAWSDIGDYHWDGDTLIIAEKSGLLEGGATVLGGTVRVPRSQRAQVENLLAQARGRDESTANSQSE
jgi:hypothetical protein